MANETVATETTADRLAELGCQLDDARTVLDFMTDMDPIDIGSDPKKMHGAACTAFRLICNAIETLEAAERWGLIPRTFAQSVPGNPAKPCYQG